MGFESLQGAAGTSSLPGIRQAARTSQHPVLLPPAMLMLPLTSALVGGRREVGLWLLE